MRALSYRPLPSISPCVTAAPVRARIPHNHIDVFLRGLAFVPSLLRYHTVTHVNPQAHAWHLLVSLNASRAVWLKYEVAPQAVFPHIPKSSKAALALEVAQRILSLRTKTQSLMVAISFLFPSRSWSLASRAALQGHRWASFLDQQMF